MTTCHGTTNQAGLANLEKWRKHFNPNQKDENIRSLRCLSAFECCHLLLRRFLPAPTSYEFVLSEEHPHTKLKTKSGDGLCPPPYFRVRANGRIWRRGPLPPPFPAKRKTPRKERRASAPHFPIPKKTPKSEEGLCPPFPERDKKEGNRNT
jgi:hypothetical protein